ncbi:hypothetical protein CN679_25535 [Bacillus pseudomycoides]|nr:hypothetical protein CN679_25535 [Bacillus pseudomycoides]
MIDLDYLNFQNNKLSNILLKSKIAKDALIKRGEYYIMNKALIERGNSETIIEFPFLISKNQHYPLT